MRAIGAVLTEVEPGRCVIEVPYSDDISQQHGFFHGGIVGAVADTAGGYAALTLLPVGYEVLTVSFTINFLRPAAGERLVAAGSVVRSGRTLSVVRMDAYVIDAAGRRSPCTALQGTMMGIGGDRQSPA